MARRVLDRRELREQADEAQRREAAGPDGAGGEAGAPAGVVKAREPAAAKGRKPRPKKAPPRLCARWGVFDAAMKQVAIFDYNQRAAVEERLAALLARQKGTYFLQVVKEPMPEPAAAAVVPGE